MPSTDAHRYERGEVQGNSLTSASMHKVQVKQVSLKIEKSTCMMVAACWGLMTDSAAETEAAVICSVSAKASSAGMAANHLAARAGRNLLPTT